VAKWYKPIGGPLRYDPQATERANRVVGRRIVGGISMKRRYIGALALVAALAVTYADARVSIAHARGVRSSGNSLPRQERIRRFPEAFHGDIPSAVLTAKLVDRNPGKVGHAGCVQQVHATLRGRPL
jgi:hypothetical protein